MRYKRTPVEKIVGKYGLAGVHEAAKLLPLASDAEFQAMCADVQVHGFVEPVEVTPQKLLLDGCTRLQAAAAVGKDPLIVECSPSDPVAYVLSKNLVRTHLTAGQKADVGGQDCQST